MAKVLRLALNIGLLAMAAIAAPFPNGHEEPSSSNTWLHPTPLLPFPELTIYSQ